MQDFLINIHQKLVFTYSFNGVFFFFCFFKSRGEKVDTEYCQNIKLKKKKKKKTTKSERNEKEMSVKNAGKSRVVGLLNES